MNCQSESTGRVMTAPSGSGLKDPHQLEILIELNIYHHQKLH